ncbi:uncharacterized protein LOC134532130 isoform X2 [Bacillus rossius redtenbacheri]|uniref:uncharacterized protein LOC134532130 isoform X2 n=1 Tax=Bacillus rossius redtenbacheri TaxID=93214 RepID=UPI002FDD3F35
MVGAALRAARLWHRGGRAGGGAPHATLLLSVGPGALRRRLGRLRAAVQVAGGARLQGRALRGAAGSGSHLWGPHLLQLRAPLALLAAGLRRAGRCVSCLLRLVCRHPPGSTPRGSTGACLVRARLDAVLQRRLPETPRAVDMALNVGSALGQFLSPLYTHFLLQHYGLQGTPLMLAGVILQAAVGSLLLDCGPARPVPPAHRPRTTAFIDASSDLLLTSASSHHKVSEDERFVSDLAPDSIAGIASRRSACGISILPKIPEEGEDGEDSPGDPSEEAGRARRQGRAEALTFSASCVGEYVVIESAQADVVPRPRATRRSGRHSGDAVVRVAGMMPHEQEFLLRAVTPATPVGNGKSQMLLVDSSTVHDLSAIAEKDRGDWRCRCPCFAALGDALRTSHTLPALLLRVSVRLCPMAFAALAPVAVRTHISESTLDEAMLTVTISGFSWLCFLVTMPWFLGMASHRQKFLYSVGSFAAAAGLYLFSESTSHDQIILNCVIIGIGQGASLATSRTVVLDALGGSALSRLGCALDVASAVVVLLAASIMGVFLGHEGGTTGCFVFLAVLQAASGLCWIVKPMMARFREHGHHDWSAGEFLQPS